MSDSFLKPGDVAVVTGAAQGIGRAIALRLAKAGARLALWDVLVDGVNETASQCRALGAEAKVYEVDMGVRDAIESASRKVIDELGAPFAVVNNAAIYPRTFIVDLDPDDWDRVLRINLTGPFLCARAFAPGMQNNKRGAVINIASTVGLKGDPRGAHYASSKAGLMALTKSFALALGADGIRVNCVLPGLSETAQPLGAMSLEQLHARAKDFPLGRVGQPDDSAALVAFLLGPDAGYITGQSISVNGGAMSIP